MIGLLDRAGYYTLMSFGVVYLGLLGFGAYWPGLLVGGGLGLLVYALPVLSGALADRIGFGAALVAGSGLLLAGYAALGAPLWLGDRDPGGSLRPEVTAGPGEWGPVLAGLLLLAAGRSLLKPACAATVQKQAPGDKAVAFGMFFILTNGGSLAGRGLCWLLRSEAHRFEPVFLVAGGAAGAALALALASPRDREDRSGPSPDHPFLDLRAALREPRCRRFLLAASGYFALFSQMFILLPLYLKGAVEPEPPLDLYGMIHPLVVVAGQLPAVRAARLLAPVPSMALGTAILSLGLLANLPPLFLPGGPQATWGGLPAGSLGMVAALAGASLGHLLVLPRVYLVLGALAPPGREGLFLGLPSLAMAAGHLAGGVLGPLVLNQVMLRGAKPGAHGLLELQPWAAAQGWILLAGLGLACAGGMGWWARRGRAPG